MKKRKYKCFNNGLNSTNKKRESIQEIKNGSHKE